MRSSELLGPAGGWSEKESVSTVAAKEARCTVTADSDATSRFGLRGEGQGDDILDPIDLLAPLRVLVVSFLGRHLVTRVIVVAAMEGVACVRDSVRRSVRSHRVETTMAMVLYGRSISRNFEVGKV